MMLAAARSPTCLLQGVGIWGINIPVAWGFAIVNFVWWIGIGHAGHADLGDPAAAAAGLAHLDQPFAEAMTLFAVACAGMFPLLHLGRPWLFYWLLPYPNTMRLWPQFRSPLVWDVFAVSTYATVSLLFWYVGLIPDLATLRDRRHSRLGAGRLRHAGDGLARLGAALAPLSRRPTCCWPGWPRRWSSRCTPSSASISRWRSCPAGTRTIFPPYFVAGAIYSGFAMVLTLAIPLRKFYGLKTSSPCATSTTWPRSCWPPG